MDIKDKVIEDLRAVIGSEYIRLDDDDGISGYAVSTRFEGMSTLDRQAVIQNALERGPYPLTREESRRVLMIAGVTPEEYSSIGAQIRVHRVRDIPRGVQILLHGGFSDAQYVQGALNNLKGVQTTVPQQSPGEIGILMSFEAVRRDGSLTKDEAIRALKADRYIEVMPNA